ncbi:hypothetical protein EBX93_16145, partial [bacterium]|nr:hypothetical protein [bacterium]
MQSFETTSKITSENTATPLKWRIYIAVTIVFIAISSYFLRASIGLKGQSVAGMFFFFGLVAVFSQNLRAVNWSTITWGFCLQMVLAVLVL